MTAFYAFRRKPEYYPPNQKKKKISDDRWSYIKRFGRIDYNNFMFFAKRFCEKVSDCYPWPSVVEVVLNYNQCEEIRTNTVIRLENVTKELFGQAVSVSLKIYSMTPFNVYEKIFGYLDCKGKYLIFYVTPPAYGKQIREVHVKELKPSGWKFKVGDGYE